MEYISIRISDIVRQVNRDWFLPAIQREFVWKKDRVERLFDSILSDFPIGSFLFWNLEQKNKDQWPIYEFIQNYDEASPHNAETNTHGIQKDLTLVLDGQQRITSLFIGLRGSYRHFYYRWRKTHLYLNLLKPPIPNDENPEDLTYDFSFRESDTPKDPSSELWYPVGRILDYNDAEDAKEDMRSRLALLPDQPQTTAAKLIGRLHNRIHTSLVGNYYRERSQDYDKVLQIFVRANSSGQDLEYSDLLLATATAKWDSLDARAEIHGFTDSLNQTGSGYKFKKDFVLKGCLYLCEELPIQYRVKNFTKRNLRTIERNWGPIRAALRCTVRLISQFGFHSKNVVAPLALLPIAFYLLKRDDPKFDQSSEVADVETQVAIRRWFVFSTLKNAFGSSSDTTLNRLREILRACDSDSPFPVEQLYGALEIEPALSEAEVERFLDFPYQGRYTNLVLSLLYPGRDWKGTVFHEDHIYPQTAFSVSSLKREGCDEAEIGRYMSKFNTLQNLQLLTDAENLSKGATPFQEWLETRDPEYRDRHLIPHLEHYGLDQFAEFCAARRELISSKLSKL